MLEIKNVPYITDFTFIKQTNIDDLAVEYNPNIDFDTIYNCPQLEVLFINLCNINIDDLKNFKKPTNLKELGINQEDAEIVPEMLDILYECDNLEKINLYFDDDIPDDEMEYQIRRFKEIGITLNFILIIMVK